MSMAQPFPVLDSAGNSRAGSPAPSSSISTSKKPKSKNKNKNKKASSRGGSKQQKSAEDGDKDKPKPNASNKKKNKKQQHKDKNNSSSNRRRNTTSATVATVKAESPLKQNDNSNELPAGLLVRGENGRARAVFSSANDIEGQYYNSMPHAPRRMSLNHYHYNDNSLGISMPMPMSATAATYVPPPPAGFRQRSFTLSQRRIASARMDAPPALTFNDDYPVPIQHYQGMPMSAPATNLHFSRRGRSQTVSHNASMTGRHVTMSQAPLGQVLAPPETQFDNIGRRHHRHHRDPVPSADLTLDYSNTIRIPTIMLQKATSEEQADDQSEPLTGEKLAMKRLQDMISSMRALTDTPQSPTTLISPKSSAHPTARFDSILEEDEDEDDEQDEPELDKQQEGTDVTATAAVSS